MFGIVVLINIASLALNWSSDLRTGAIISLVAALWAFGIATNYGADRASIPNYAALMGIASGLTGLVLAVMGVAS